MNPIRHRLLMLSASLLLSGASVRGEEPAAEPLELTRLREQFQHRVDQEMVPWREKYRKELQKLEDRLIAERKLVEALAVKKEREANAPLSTEPAASVAGGIAKAPGSEDEAREMLMGTVWLVYNKEDRKRAAPVDVFHFLDDEKVYVFSRKNPFKWVIQSSTGISIQFPEGAFEINLDFPKMAGTTKFLGIDYSIVNAGSPNASKK